MYLGNLMNKIVIEKMTVAQLGKKFPAFQATGIFVTVFRGTHLLTLHGRQDSSLYPTLVVYSRWGNELYSVTVTGLYLFHCS